MFTKEIKNTLISKNTILCPEFTYSEWTKNPTADVISGEYKETQKVTLSCDTDKAAIYYTLDGSDPTEYNGILYTEPITIDGAVTLKFYAAAVGMNDSDVMTEQYVINYDGARSAWMTYDELPDEVKENQDTYEIYTDTGYTYKDVKTTRLAAEAAALESAGWQAQEDENWSDYTEWMDEPMLDDGSYIRVDGESQPVYKNAQKYQYSHYVYVDGTATCYTKEEAEGKDCTYETKEFETPLRASFDKNGEPYYVYDGQTWYNQTKVTGQVQSGAQYRYRYKEVTYYKWSDYTMDMPEETEQREYKEVSVCSYVRHNSYLVTFHLGIGIPQTKIMEAGSKIDVSEYQNITGYDFDGLYTDEDYTNEWDPENDTISQNTDIYIKEQAKTYQVTFVYPDGRKIEEQSVEYMDAATAPETEEMSGYRFVGWDTDDYLSVQEDMTVTAKYIPESEYATVELDNDNLTLYVGKSAGLSAQISPADHAGDEVEWSSSDETVACVSATGIVTAVAQGTAVITVKVKETGETASCEVTVKVNTDKTLLLLKNSKLKVDGNGYLRGVKAGANTAEEISREFENDAVICKDKKGNSLADTGLLGTGSSVCLVRGNKELDRIPVVVTAELTGDGVVNTRDVAFLARALLEKEVPEDAQILAGDVNGDGKVNNRDVALISRYLVGKEEF